MDKEKTKYETLHITSEAKDAVFYAKKRRETYSETILRVFKFYKKKGEKSD